jgi:hypothetical protein
MKLLIAVKSCVQHQELGYHEVIRNTWGKDYSDVLFFTGPGAVNPAEDEVQLDCPDDYPSLPQKTRAICNFAVDTTYDYIFLCDTDTYLIPSKLLSCGFENYDYVGKIDRPFGMTFPYITVSRDGAIENHPSVYPWASGGYGYFLSRKALGVIAYMTPIGWAEDFIVGNVLGKLYDSGEISMLNTPGENYSWHFPAHQYKSGYDLSFRWMETMYATHR